MRDLRETHPSVRTSALARTARSAHAGAILLLLFLATTLAGCSGASSSGTSRDAGTKTSSSSGAPDGGAALPSRAGRPRNVVLISIDTLRADHLGAYGYGPPTSPRFDAFAARSVLFEDCRSASGHTLSSHKAILSGRNVSSFLGAFSSRGAPETTAIGPMPYYELAFRGWPFPSLAARLREAGLYTLGLTDGGFLQTPFGFADGFDDYRSAGSGFARQRSKAEDWIEGNPDRPFFLFLHGYDVHCPYDPPEPYVKLFETGDRGRLEFNGTCGKGYFDKLELTRSDKEHIVRRYDASIRQADEELGKFLDFLERRGRLADTVIVVTSDHGESLGEREFVGHGELYENQLRVPLLVYAPGAPAGRVKAPVAGVDVTPTILDLVLGAVPADLDGWSLAGFVTRAAGGRSASVFETRPRLSAITINEGRGYRTRLRKAAAEAGGYKLVVDFDAGERALYDLSRDPGETKNVAEAHRREEALLLEVLTRNDTGRLRGYDPASRESNPDLTPEMREELESLGYAGG